VIYTLTLTFFEDSTRTWGQLFTSIST